MLESVDSRRLRAYLDAYEYNNRRDVLSSAREGGEGKGG